MDLFVSNRYSDKCDGSQAHPFSSVQQLLAEVQISVDNKIEAKIFIEVDDSYKELSKAQMKKELKLFKASQRKTKPSDDQKFEKKIEEAVVNKINLSEAKKAKIFQLKEFRGQRVIVRGWIQHLRKQGKKLLFATLRDGSGYLQCLFEKDVESINLTCESSVILCGIIDELPEGKVAEGGHELKVDSWELIGSAPSGGVETVLNTDSDPDVLFNNRHLMIRGEHSSAIFQMESVALFAFEQHYKSRNFRQTIFPGIVQNQCEGGSTLFKLDYYGEEAYLSQSCQLYLETMLPVVGDCFTIAKSHRAEKSRTRRHLSEYAHIEAEMMFVTFDELLDHIEDMLLSVSRLVLEMDAEWLYKVNPDYKPLVGPIRRMTYSDAIEFLREHGIFKPDGMTYEFGDDIPEGAERAMLAIIDEPVMLTRFPHEIKAFYMARCADDTRVTESVDVLLPGVGEVVGGSMRIWDYDELMAAYAREGLDTSRYKFYTDQRLYGSVPHGGYGLGFERFLTWMLKKDHIRDVCTYPRYMGRCTP